MTSSSPRKLDLTDYQIKKLGNAIINGSESVITIKPEQNHKGNSIHLTDRTINKLKTKLCKIRRI